MASTVRGSISSWRFCRPRREAAGKPGEMISASRHDAASGSVPAEACEYCESSARKHSPLASLQIEHIMATATAAATRRKTWHWRVLIAIWPRGTNIAGIDPLATALPLHCFIRARQRCRTNTLSGRAECWSAKRQLLPHDNRRVANQLRRTSSTAVGGIRKSASWWGLARIIFRARAFEGVAVSPRHRGLVRQWPTAHRQHAERDDHTPLPSRGRLAQSQPIAMKCAGLVDALIRMGAEVVALGLQQVRR